VQPIFTSVPAVTVRIAPFWMTTSWFRFWVPLQVVLVVMMVAVGAVMDVGPAVSSPPLLAAKTAGSGVRLAAMVGDGNKAASKIRITNNLIQFFNDLLLVTVLQCIWTATYHLPYSWTEQFPDDANRF